MIHFWSLKYTRRRALKFANFNVIEKITGKRIISKNWVLLFMRLIILCCLILSVSGATFWYNGRGSDFNYGLVIDASSSMAADDYEPNRISAAKEAALRFVNAVGVSKMGVVTFSGTTFIKQRLTDNGGDIRDAIEKIRIEDVGGTAIGDALVTGSNLFFTEGKEGNVLVLLTDGQTNVGLSVEEAIPFLLENEILVHTVGIGTEEGGEFVGVVSRLDEVTLRFIASQTGGEYFGVKDVSELKDAFDKIANSRVKRIGKNLTVVLLLVGVVLLLVEWGLMNTKYRSLP
jgi:Ca-activated chloride channel homolog